ncbi:two-component system sensor histidine kinase NtrB [Salinimicrobium sp. GXAS 041]|uniref:two-component system sensor histidine kinase NtrB n=1 Tax=Salinimicrobium sp. GXAS 041 TaxID=3400806 RepID=UPI003C76A9D7
MKRSSRIVGEHLIKESSRSLVKWDSLEDHQILIFVTNLRSFEIVFTNLGASHYLKSRENTTIRKEQNQFKKFIHKEDYQDFVLHLESLENLSKDREEEITVRVKSPLRGVKKISFRHRLYSGAGNEKDQLIIGFGREVKPSAPQSPGVAQRFYEKALLQNWKKHNTLIDAIKEGFCVVDILFDAQKIPVDYLFLESNHTFEKQIKFSHINEKTIKELSAGHKEHWFKILGKVALTGEPVQFECFSQDLDQSWFNVHAFPIGEEENYQVGLLLSNITREKIWEEKFNKTEELKFSEEQIRSEELFQNYHLYKSIFNNTTIGLGILKPVFKKNGELVDFLYLRANKLLLDHYPENIIGQSYLRFNPVSIDNGVFEAFKNVMLSGTTDDFDIKSTEKGKKSWYRMTGRRENNLLIISIENISQRKIKANRLKENIRFKKQIAEASPDIIMILNLHKENVRYINRDMADQPGMRKKDIDGMPISCILPFIHPHDREKAMNFHNEITDAENREIFDIEFRFQTSDNYFEWFNARAKVFMRDKDSKVCEYILLLRNINQQKETQKALLQAEKLSIKGEVARTLAHELRNPMASIGMVADILAKKNKLEDTPENANYIEVIKRSTKVLNKLVNDLLSSSNYTAFSPVKCCLAETLDKALQDAGDRIYLTGVKVIQEYKGNYNVLADPEKLKIALLNIIVNASEAMNPDEGVLHLKIVRNRNDHVLTIEDNGCGMEKYQLDKLFDAFYTQKPHGVGIGLSSVKSILEEHDAKIVVDSKINEGTTFQLTFHRYESFQRT